MPLVSTIGLYVEPENRKLFNNESEYHLIFVPFPTKKTFGAFRQKESFVTMGGNGLIEIKTLSVAVPQPLSTVT